MMIEKKYDVVIVGAGIGGLSTAKELKGKGLNILLIDENPELGGQYLRSSQVKTYEKWESKTRKYGLKLIEEIKESDIKVLNSAVSSGVFKERKLVFNYRGKVYNVDFNYLVIATGARETFLPFPGWTLPGVYSTGAYQVLVKSYNTIPSKDIVIYGEGPFLYAVAYELLYYGIKPKEIIFRNHILKNIKPSLKMLSYPSKLFEGMVYLEEILRNFVKISFGWRIIKAEGNGKLKRVYFKNKKGKEKVIETESLAIGVGFAPNIELFQQAGCKIYFDRELDEWLPLINDYYETTVSGIFSVGETNGVGGAEKSKFEGNFVGKYILYKKGKLEEKEFISFYKKQNKKKKKYKRYSKIFKELSSVDLSDYKNIDKGTIICRCEDVRVKDIENFLSNAKDELDPLKMYARVGLGLCQGRTCGPVLQRIIKSKYSTLPKPFNVRPPIKPVNIDDFS